MPTKCPKGKVINPATGRCVNKNSPVLKKVKNVKNLKNVNNVPKKCPKGKVINPATGRCVNKNSPVLKKVQPQIITVSPLISPVVNPVVNPKATPFASPFVALNKKVRIDVLPMIIDNTDNPVPPVPLNKNNLDKLVDWWKLRLKHPLHPLKNLKVIADYKNKSIIIVYDFPNTISDDIDLKINNEMIADPDDDGNYPIYVKNNQIVSINRDVSNGGKDVLVGGKLAQIIN